MGEDNNYQKLEKSAMKCMRINAAITAVVLLAVEIITVCIVGIADVPIWLWISFGAFSLFLLFYVIVSPKVRYSRYRYSIDEEAIRVREGFLWISYSIVPIERLHKIELSQGPIARMFHLFTVNVTTAGGEVDIKFIKEDVANEIAEHLKDVINRIVAEEREKR